MSGVPLAAVNLRDDGVRMNVFIHDSGMIEMAAPVSTKKSTFILSSIIATLKVWVCPIVAIGHTPISFPNCKLAKLGLTVQRDSVYLANDTKSGMIWYPCQKSNGLFTLLALGS